MKYFRYPFFFFGVMQRAARNLRSSTRSKQTNALFLTKPILYGYHTTCTMYLRPTNVGELKADRAYASLPRGGMLMQVLGLSEISGPVDHGIYDVTTEYSVL